MYACAPERGADPHVLPYIEGTTIRVRVANNCCLILTKLHFLHYSGADTWIYLMGMPTPMTGVPTYCATKFSLNFWRHLSWISKPGRIPSLVRHLLTSWWQHGGWTFPIHVLKNKRWYLHGVIFTNYFFKFYTERTISQ